MAESTGDRARPSAGRRPAWPIDSNDGLHLSPACGRSSGRFMYTVAVCFGFDEARSRRRRKPRLAFLFHLCSTWRDTRRFVSVVSAGGRARLHGGAGARPAGWVDGGTAARLHRRSRPDRLRGSGGAGGGYEPESAYRLKRRGGAESFARAWDSILAARPRGATGFNLVWHRIVRRALADGGSVRIEAASPADPLDEGPGSAAGGRRRERSR